MNENTTEDAPQIRPPRRVLTIAAFLIAVAAWIALPISYIASLAGAVVAVVTSAFALAQPRGAWRNLALTALVAAAVLCLVFAIFFSALYIIAK